MTKQELIKQLMDSIIIVENYNEILPILFEKYILDGKSSLDIYNFNEQFAYTFKTNPYLWVEYLKDNKFNSLNELNLNSSKYNAVHKLLIKIKSLYGAKYMRLTQFSNDPFMLTTTNINVKHNETTHTIRFVRGDMEYLNFNFTVDSLLISMITMQHSLIGAIKEGLFSLSDQTVSDYLKVSTELNQTLRNIIENNKIDNPPSQVEV